MTDDAIYSLAEIDAGARKAIRGAGYPWGLAEEAGRAARWLTAWSEDGSRAIADHVRGLSGASPRLAAPEGMNGAADPILVGAAIVDRLPAAGQSSTFKNVTVSPLLIGIVGFAAEPMGLILTLDWQGGSVQVGNGGVSRRLDGLAWGPADLCVAAAIGSVTGGGRRIAMPVACDVWAVIERFAHETYVPASEESRALGAGAGLSDND